MRNIACGEAPFLKLLREVQEHRPESSGYLNPFFALMVESEGDPWRAFVEDNLEKALTDKLMHYISADRYANLEDPEVNLVYDLYDVVLERRGRGLPLTRSFVLDEVWPPIVTGKQIGRAHV